MRALTGLIAIGLFPLVLAGNVELAWAQGKFVGDPIARWDGDGRSMTLVEKFEYIDPSGRRWRVPSGATVDGASIPKIFWSFMGGPFDGKYRNASVIHDYFCENRRRRWQDVHRVFYDAMLTSGLESSKAYLMWKAVEKFGPRWDEPRIDPRCLKPNGQFDFDKCTENVDVIASDVVLPSASQRELDEFFNEMKPVANPADLQQLRASIEKAPR